MLQTNSKGNYSFIPGPGPFSAAVTAESGFEIVHVRFLPLLPLNKGYVRVERHLHEVQRPLSALCGMELRIPKFLSSRGFDEFNRPYVEQLRSWGLGLDGTNPVRARTLCSELDPFRSLCSPVVTILRRRAPMALLLCCLVPRKSRLAKAVDRLWREEIPRPRGCGRNLTVSCGCWAVFFLRWSFSGKWQRR